MPMSIIRTTFPISTNTILLHPVTRQVHLGELSTHGLRQADAVQMALEQPCAVQRKDKRGGQEAGRRLPLLQRTVDSHQPPFAGYV